jgi:ribosomal protein S18 acetylase RimI-like enzyme
MSPITLRVATEADAALLRELGIRLFEQSFGAQNTVDDMRLYLADAFRLERVRANLSDLHQRTWIAEDGSNGAVGYAVLKQSPAPSVLRAQQSAEIVRLYADQRWHGRGVGAALMEACLHEARSWKSDWVWLGVWETNARAIAFYQKHGFRNVGSQTFLLGTDVQNDLVMALRLD